MVSKTIDELKKESPLSLLNYFKDLVTESNSLIETKRNSKMNKNLLNQYEKSINRLINETKKNEIIFEKDEKYAIEIQIGLISKMQVEIDRLTNESGLSFKGLNKIYPNGAHAVHNFDLEIKEGEFIVFVGPSGCGKSTTLRMIAGLEEISGGELALNGKLVNKLSPKDRDIAMVFQDYALYGHMTVYHNVAFSLMIQKIKAEIIHERVMKAADILQLHPYLNRKPRQLSGGQKQRVALGRAIVRNPKVFLLDEPLSNLDAKLRDGMRMELAKLQQDLNITMIYVTHDQVEAMTLADRIVIMKDGYVQQISAPYDLYHNPVNQFVATFIGSPPMNMLEGTVNGNQTFNILNGETIKIEDEYFKVLKAQGYINKNVILGIRPEDSLMDKANLSKYSDYQINATIELIELLGSDYLIRLNYSSGLFIAKVISYGSYKSGDKVKIAFNASKIHFFDKETTKRIIKGGEENGQH